MDDFGLVKGHKPSGIEVGTAVYRLFARPRLYVNKGWKVVETL
jgi:hypothetical protein